MKLFKLAYLYLVAHKKAGYAFGMFVSTNDPKYKKEYLRRMRQANKLIDRIK